MDYFKQGEEFAQRYVWNKFKNSWLTLFGGIASAIVPIGIALSEYPAIFQVFTLIPLGIVASSFYWYKILNAKKYAKEGAKIFQDYYKDKEEKSILDEFNNIYFSSTKDKKLKEEFKTSYDMFIKAINEQKIISDIFKNQTHDKANDAFKSGLKLLKEMKDILSLLENVNLNQLNKELIKSEQKNKEYLEEKIKLYENNESILEDLRVLLKELIHSFDVSKLNLASATSNFDSKFEVEDSTKSLVAAMNAAKKVQQRVSSDNLDMSRYINQ